MIWKWNSALMLWILDKNSIALDIFIYRWSCNWIIFILKTSVTRIAFWRFVKIIIVVQVNIWWGHFIVKAFFRFWISMRLWESLTCLWFGYSETWRLVLLLSVCYYFSRRCSLRKVAKSWWGWVELRIINMNWREIIFLFIRIFSLNYLIFWIHFWI